MVFLKKFNATFNASSNSYFSILTQKFWFLLL
jgi:hypothetical protein